MDAVAVPEADRITPLPISTENQPRRRRSFLGAIGAFFDGLLGAAALICGLAVISAIPVLNLLSLGYLLEASRRVAISGMMRNGFVGIAKAAVVGKIVLCSWLLWLPVRFSLDLYWDSQMMDPTSLPTRNLRLLCIFLILVLTVHIAWACFRGGRLRHFAWPAPLRFVRWIGEPGEIRNTFRRLAGFVGNLRLPYYFWLGARGFFGAAIWLAVPVLVLFGASNLSNPGLSALLSFFGGILLGVSVLYIPFLQTRFAVEGKFREFLSFRGTRQAFRRAPLAFWLALLVTLLFAVPLYLLKIELAPREVAWLSNLVFVVFIFPARILVGWAVGRSLKRDTPRIWVSRWLARLAALPVVAAYVFVVWLTQYLSWHGSWGLLEQHAFLVPAPMLGL